MKTILIPTDFSDISRNAIDYAVEIAKPFNSRLVLFHSYHLPIVNSEMPVNLPSEVEVEKSIMDSLKKIERNIHDKNGKGISVEIVCKQGLAGDVINEYVKDNKIDLIVMGTNGGGLITEKLLGSVTTSLIRKSDCPVLVVGNNSKFKDIKKIVLAYDYRETNSTALNSLIELARAFNAHIYVLNVISKPELVPSTKEAIGGLKLEHSLEGIDHSFEICENDDVVNGINGFVKEKQADMVVMISHKHSFIWKLFHETNTKHMAFHLSAPFLALHE